MPLKIFFLTILSLPCFSQADQVTMSFKISNGAGKRLVVSNFFNVKEERIIPNNGEIVISYPISKATFLDIKTDDHSQGLYFQPGLTYTILFDLSKRESGYQFTEKNGMINNYFESVNQIIQTFLFKNKKYYEWDTEEYPTGIQLLENMIDHERAYFIKTHSFSVDEQKLMAAETKALLLSFKMNHFLAFYHPYSSSKKQKDVPEYFKDIEKTMLFDSLLMEAFSNSYTMALIFYTNIAWGNELAKTTDINTVGKHNFLSLAYPVIKNKQVPESVREFLLYHLLTYSMAGYRAMPDDFDGHYLEFKKAYPVSEYTQLINPLIEKIKALHSKVPAADFEGKDIDGKIYRLSDFKGKLVYLDVWATWCAPCVKEFPSLIDLQKKFENNEKVAILSISLDNDPEKWKAFLKKNAAEIGHHLYLPNEELNKFTRAYSLKGAPYYMLIDPSGYMINANFDSPSSPGIEKKLNELLKNNNQEKDN